MCKDRPTNSNSALALAQSLFGRRCINNESRSINVVCVSVWLGVHGSCRLCARKLVSSLDTRLFPDEFARAMDGIIKIHF